MTRTIGTVLMISFLATTPLAGAAQPAVTDLTGTFRGAGAAVERLEVYELAGIVLIRGRVASEADAARLGQFARTLGYERVANLVQVIRHDDEAIARRAEVELAMHRALEGCRFTVESNGGIVRIAGFVRHELQKDVALQVLRSVDGVQGIEANLERF